MRVNNDCIKAILNFVIENTGINDEGDKCSVKQTNLYQIIQALQNDFEKEVIAHSTLYAQKCGYIDMTPIRDINNISYALCKISDVTPIGYEYLEKE